MQSIHEETETYFGPEQIRSGPETPFIKEILLVTVVSANTILSNTHRTANVFRIHVLRLPQDGIREAYEQAIRRH